MKDCRNHYKKQILQDIKGLVFGNADSFIEVNNNKIFIPFDSKGKIKNVKASIAVANKKASEINKKYLSNRYGELVSVDSTNLLGAYINIHIPNSIIEAYAAKHEAEQTQIEDARRAGEDYEDRYLFDNLPASQDGYNYGIYLENKIQMQKFFSRRIKILEEMSNKSKKDLEQIEQFKEISRRLKKDIANLENETAILENFFEYFNQDLEVIEEILLDNPTLDNLLSARNFVDMLKFVYGFDPNDVTREESDKVNFSDVKFEELPGEQKLMFENFLNSISQVDNKLTNKELDLTQKEIEKVLKNPNSNSHEVKEAKDLEEKIKDVSQLSFLFLPIDGDPDSTPIQQFVRKTFDDAVAKEETFDLRQQLNNIKPKLENKLKELGYKNDSGILGKLFTPVTYDLFKIKSDTGKNRLINKYSETWDALENTVENRFKAIQKINFKKNKDIQDFAKIKQSKKDLFKMLKPNVTFIDVTRIPELKGDIDINNSFGNFFLEDAESIKYKEELINSLMSSSGNRKIAERIYNKVVEEQRNKIFAFEISYEQYKQRLFKKHSVEEVSKLPSIDRNKLLEKYYTESPFAFSESFRNTGDSEVIKIFYDSKGSRKELLEPAALTYSSYLPNNPKYINKTFEEVIETDETLYEAWEMFDDSLSFINKNRKYENNSGLNEFEDSITYEYDMIKQHANSIQGMAKYFTKEAANRIKAILSTSRFVDKNSDLKLNGTIKSLDQVVRERSKPLAKSLSSLGLISGIIYESAKLTDKQKEFLVKENKGEALPKNFNVDELVNNITERKILKEQNLDLVETLTSQLETVQLFKAKKEIENKLLFAKNQIEKAKKTRDKEAKTNAIKQVQDFIIKHLYGVNNRPNWMSFRQNDKSFTTVFNSHEKEMIEEIDKAINFIKEVHKNKLPEAARKDIQELEKIKKSKGRAVTTGSIFETVAIRLNILVGLGLNLPSQIGNYVMGNIAGRQNDGLEWSEGNYVKASSYTRKWKIARRKLSKKEKAKYKLTNTLIDSLGVFQNSANELDRIRESAYYNNALKFVTNPLHIVGEVEKTIQRPQILAVLGDVEIEDKNGNIVYAFNKNDLSNPHPAFELDETGNLNLKEDFNTENNRNTWINRNSQEYVDLFGESGIVPTMIAKINGDYRETSTTQIKETSLGSLAMMFKTWLPAYIMRRYGKTDGVTSKLIDSGRYSETAALTSLTGMMYAGIGASVFVSPIIPIGIVAGFMGYKKHKMLIQEEGYYFVNLMKDLQKTLLSLQFATNVVRTSGAVGAKVLQQSGDSIFGKRFISNEIINKIGGFKQIEGESKAEYEKNLARLQFLLTEASTTLSLLSLKVLVNAFMFPDEEEEKVFKNEKGHQKYVDHPTVGMYYMLENMLTRFGNDVNLVNDPIAVAKNVLDGSNSDFFTRFTKMLNSFYDQAVKGDYTKGPNAGRNRISVNVGNMVVPKGLTDFSLGFGKISSQDYTQKDALNRIFMSELDKNEEERTKQRSQRKLELTEHWENIRPYWTKEKRKKKIQKILKKEFPAIKKYFNEDGTLKIGKEHKVQRYK